MISTRFASLVIVGTILQAVAAQTSLYIPGFSPQAISANVIGVDSDGRTTWQVAPGQPSGTLQNYDFTGTATLIKGPNDAVIISQGPYHLSQSRQISNGLADCTVVVGQNGAAAAVSVQETASSFAAQVGSTLAQPTGNPSSPAYPSTGPSRSSQNVTPLQSATQQNGAIAFSVSSNLAGVLGIMAAISLL